MSEKENYLTSKEAGKIKDCHLMQHRLSGKLDFVKKGNSFLYKEEDVLKIKDKKQ